jgi:hypothetical protein
MPSKNTTPEENHDLYISESPMDVTRDGVILRTMGFSVIYQGMPLNAQTPFRTLAEQVAHKAAEQLKKDVWTWYGQAGRFSLTPEYCHGKGAQQ